MPNTRPRSSSSPRVVIAALLLLMGTASAVAGAPTRHRITISDMSFGAAPARVRVGDTVEWLNLDAVMHTATADGVWDVTIAAGKTAHVVVKRSGVFPYYCKYHPNMRATMTVKR